MDFHNIISKINNASRLFKPRDTIIVLQTDPLRSFFLKWYTKDLSPDPHIRMDTPTTIIELCEEKLLKPFYRELALAGETFNLNVILLGGISAISQSLAESVKLDHLTRSSTQIIADHLGERLNFVDSYFFDVEYLLANNSYLEARYNNYIKGQDFVPHIDTIKKKNKFWSDNPEYFTYNHTTERGTEIVADQLCEHIKMRGVLCQS